MKYCPNCKTDYTDETLQYCLQDGTPLIAAAATPTEAFSQSEAQTAFIPERPTQGWEQARETVKPAQAFNPPPKPKKSYVGWIVGVVAVLLLGVLAVAGGVLYLLYKAGSSTTTETYPYPTPSIASSSPSNTNTGSKNIANVPASALTMEKYNRINNGMSFKEVVDILGGGGVEQMRSGTGKYEVTSYKWEGPNYQFVTVIFMGDKVNSKVQYGLK